VKLVGIGEVKLMAWLFRLTFMTEPAAILYKTRPLVTKNGEAVGVVGESVVGDLVGCEVGDFVVGDFVVGEVGDLVGNCVLGTVGDWVVGEVVGDFVVGEVGFPVGDEVGESVGALVGNLVGDFVGESVVGALVVGDEVGKVGGVGPVGDFVGKAVGDFVGCLVGDFDGSSVGDLVVGAKVVGEPVVGDFVGAFVGESVVNDPEYTHIYRIFVLEQDCEYTLIQSLVTTSESPTRPVVAELAKEPQFAATPPPSFDPVQISTELETTPAFCKEFVRTFPVPLNMVLHTPMTTPV